MTDSCIRIVGQSILAVFQGSASNRICNLEILGKVRKQNASETPEICKQKEPKKHTCGMN